MTSPSRSGLFQVESHCCYFDWLPVAAKISERAVNVPDSSDAIYIGRVKRNDQIIPGAVKDGVCRFLFEGNWHEERGEIEVMEDLYGAAQGVLSWGQAEEKDGRILLSTNCLVGGEYSDGLYLIGRKRGTAEIVPVAVKKENRDFGEGHIVYEGEPITDVEVLESTYHRVLMICPPGPPSPSEPAAASS